MEDRAVGEERVRKPRSPGPSIRPRFVRRAKTLKEDQRFVQAVATTRQTWNGDHPAFAIRDMERAPKDLDPHPLNIVWPPRIVFLQEHAKASRREPDPRVR